MPLAGAIPAVASWRLSALPRGLKATEIEMLRMPYLSTQEIVALTDAAGAL